jgi:hypothetical protein
MKSSLGRRLCYQAAACIVLVVGGASLGINDGSYLVLAMPLVSARIYLPAE